MNEEQHERAGLCGPSFESARRRRLRHSEKRRGIVFLNVAAGHAPHSALWPRLTHSHALGPGRAGSGRAGEGYIQNTTNTPPKKPRFARLHSPTLPSIPDSCPITSQTSLPAQLKSGFRQWAFCESPCTGLLEHPTPNFSGSSARFCPSLNVHPPSQLRPHSLKVACALHECPETGRHGQSSPRSSMDKRMSALLSH